MLEGAVLTESYSYDNNSNLITRTNQKDNVTTTYTYNYANLVSGISTNNNQLPNYTYSYRADGMQISKVETLTGSPAKTTSYDYDLQGRLKSESVGGVTTAYDYDSSGNRQTMTVSGAGAYSMSYQYDSVNALTKTTKTKSGSPQEVTTYTYDANGNQLTKAVGAATVETLGYNARDQLVTYNVNGVPSTYTYRPDGLRHSKTVAGIAAKHIWDGANMAAETRADGTVNKVYSYFLNTSRKNVAKPGSGTVEALELKLFPASGYSQTRIESLILSTQKTYVAEFDYWSDLAGTEFHLGLYGTDKSWIFYQCGTTVKNERLEISTTNPNMADIGFYFEVLGGKGTSGNVYISNFRFYEKGGAGSGAPPIDSKPFRYTGAFFDLSSGVYTKDFVNFWQTSMQSIAKPGSSTVEETLVIGTVKHAVANTDVLNLTPGVDYILEFDFWADTAGNGFHVDLVTPDWNYVFAGHRQATKTPQHAQCLFDTVYSCRLLPPWTASALTQRIS